MAATVPFMNGRESILAFFIGATKREIPSKTWDISRDVTKINDGVNGEDRDRLDTVTNFFVVSVGVWMPDAKLISAFIEDQANDDAGVQPLDKAFSLKLKPRDGSKVAFICSEGTLDDWKIASGGRADRIMTTVPLRFRYVKQAPL